MTKNNRIAAARQAGRADAARGTNNPTGTSFLEDIVTMGHAGRDKIEREAYKEGHADKTREMKSKK